MPHPVATTSLEILSMKVAVHRLILEIGCQLAVRKKDEIAPDLDWQIINQLVSIDKGKIILKIEISSVERGKKEKM